jgi:alpha-tubulin suppressor-like RCC1 family protein
VSGDLDFTTVEPGGFHTCGITAAGDTYCWGLGIEGQLGNGSTVDESTPQLVSGELEFATVVAGWWHTCGITTVGDAYCWGYGAMGQLGNGSIADQSTPQPVQR